MTETTRRALTLTAAVAAGAFGGWIFGFAGARTVTRGGEAAADALIPVEDLRIDRIRRQALRAELRRIVGLQEEALAETGSFLPTREALGERPDFHLRSFERPVAWGVREGALRPVGWVGWLTHDAGPVGEACAVSLAAEPAYAAGIPLPRAGRIRCSWDPATRINRFRRGLGFTTP